MKSIKLTTQTPGDGLHDITDRVKEVLSTQLCSRGESGLLHLFLQHTSCALTINEAYDPLAARDMEKFLKHLAPESLSFIQHTDEGPDDSPSHMKALITGHSLTIPVIEGEMQLGTWQGIYLCEFRSSPKNRNILISFMA